MNFTRPTWQTLTEGSASGLPELLRLLNRRLTGALDPLGKAAGFLEDSSRVLKVTFNPLNLTSPDYATTNQTEHAGNGTFYTRDIDGTILIDTTGMNAAGSFTHGLVLGTLGRAPDLTYQAPAGKRITIRKINTGDAPVRIRALRPPSLTPANVDGSTTEKSLPAGEFATYVCDYAGNWWSV